MTVGCLLPESKWHKKIFSSISSLKCNYFRAGVMQGVLVAIGAGVMWFIIYGSYALAFWWSSSWTIGKFVRKIQDPDNCYARYTPASLLIVTQIGNNYKSFHIDDWISGRTTCWQLLNLDPRTIYILVATLAWLEHCLGLGQSKDILYRQWDEQLTISFQYSSTKRRCWGFSSTKGFTDVCLGQFLFNIASFQR